MRIDIKLPGFLYGQIIQDLTRAHPFAAERVGFVFGHIGSLANEGKLILLNRYHTIPDDQYMDDPTVGARIGSDALTWAMQAVYHGRQAREGIFHVHMHAHEGQPEMSAVDRCEIPKLMPGFQSVGREAAHGSIILSRNHGSGWVWLPTLTEPICVDSICVIGAPVRVFERRIAKRARRITK